MAINNYVAMNDDDDDDNNSVSFLSLFILYSFRSHLFYTFCIIITSGSMSPEFLEIIKD